MERMQECVCNLKTTHTHTHVIIHQRSKVRFLSNTAAVMSVVSGVVLNVFVDL